MKKPNGQFVIPPGKGEAFLSDLPVGKFHGVGPVTAAKMNRLGIFTGADLRGQEPEFLRAHFGKSGPWFHAIARGEGDRAVISNRPRKSSGTERTFQNDLLDPSEIEARISEMADEVWRWCEKADAFGRTVTVKVKYADFQQITRSRTPGSSIASRELLHGLSLALIRSVFPLEKGIRLVGVTVSNFEADEPEDHEQLQLGFG